MAQEKKINHYEVVNNYLLIKWDDESEAMIELTSLRDACPCANCAGEKDVFGTAYKGPETEKSDTSYQLIGIESVGYYGLRPLWGDKHSTGIFSSETLEILTT